MIRRLPLFWQRFFIVLSGASMAQAIPFLTMPVLTRMLSPNELGPYFIWMGIVAVLSVVLSLRLDVAVFSAHTNQQLQALINAAIVCSVLIAGMVYVILFSMDYFYSAKVKELHLDRWRIEALLLGIVWAINMVIQNAYIYGAYFKRQAAVKIIQAGLISIAQIGAVFMGLGVKGIIQLQIIATLAVVIWNIIDIYKKFKFSLTKKNIFNFWDTLKKYWRFPIFSMPADFISSFAGQLPMLMMGGRFGASPAGQYALTNKSLAVPMKLLAGSILSVFKEEAARHYREKGECRDIFTKTFKSLALLGILPFGALYFFAEQIFIIFFGEEWRDAGVYASILTPMFYVQFVISPLSYTLYLANNQFSDLIWQLALLTVTTCIFYFTNELILAIKWYAFGYSILYIIYLWIAYHSACGNKSADYEF